MSSNWDNPAITEDQVETFKKWADQWKMQPCEVCGAQAWVISGLHCVPGHQQTWEPWIDIFGLSISVVMIYCDNCANARFFVARPTGVIPAERTGPMPPKPLDLKVCNSAKGELLFNHQLFLKVGEVETLSGYGIVPIEFTASDSLKIVESSADPVEVTWPEGNKLRISFKEAPRYPSLSFFELYTDTTRVDPRGVSETFIITTTGTVTIVASGLVNSKALTMLDIKLSQYIRVKGEP